MTLSNELVGKVSVMACFKEAFWQQPGGDETQCLRLESSRAPPQYELEVAPKIPQFVKTIFMQLVKFIHSYVHAVKGTQ
jgi:hypothetical protein